jgi:hypothetical protein
MIFSQEAIYSLDTLSFTDEAWFHLSGYINGQNNVIWSSENPQAVQENHMHPSNQLLTCEFRTEILMPLLFEETGKE